jgi:hypothetical protein
MVASRRGQGQGAALMTAQPRDDARVDERGGRSPRGRDHPPSGDVQFVPTLTSFARCAGMLRQASAGTGFPRAVRDRAAAPRATVFAGRLAPSRLGPSGRAVASSSPIVPPMRCPGSGLWRSRRLSAAKPCAPPAGRRGRGVPHPAAMAILPPPPRQPAGEPSAGPWSSPLSTKAPEGPNLVAPEGEFFGEFSGTAAQDAVWN